MKKYSSGLKFVHFSWTREMLETKPNSKEALAERRAKLDFTEKELELKKVQLRGTSGARAKQAIKSQGKKPSKGGPSSGLDWHIVNNDK